MNFTALLILLVLMGTSCSSPVRLCKTMGHMHNFKHVSELGNLSVAPWTMRVDTVAGREPENILHATCTVCTVPGMIAKPITFQVYVYNCNTKPCERYPYKVTVGCTCVRE